MATNYVVKNGIIEQGGFRTYGSLSNIAITFSAGVFSITGNDGTALSTSNTAFVTLGSTTAGQIVTLALQTPQTIQDAAGTSQILGRWGTTASVAWGST